MRRWGAGLATLLVAGAVAGGVIVSGSGEGGICAYPSCFPDASNTGVPDGTSLTTYSGPNPITVDGTVLDGVSHTTGSLVIDAAGVIIRNSYISAPDEEVIYCADDNAACADGDPTLVEDSTIDCTGGGSSGPVGRASGIAESNITLRRVDISACENGLSMSDNLLIEDSFIHDLYNDNAIPPPDGAHADGIQFGIGHRETAAGPIIDGAKDITIRHNTIYSSGFSNDGLTEALGTAAIISNHAPNLDENILIEENLLAGGSATLYCVQSGGAGVNYDVLNNHFSTVLTDEFGHHPANTVGVGFFAPSDDCSNETLSGNVLHETGDPITLP